MTVADLITAGTVILVAQRGHPLAGEVGTVVGAGAERLVADLDGGRTVQLAVAACLPVHRCPHCGKTSASPEDIKERYCGACSHFCDDPIGDD
jgi:hypothetical protein